MASIPTGFVDTTIELHGETYKYVVYVPDDYTPQRTWPAVLYMHGAGERGVDGRVHSLHGLGLAIRKHVDRYPCIVVMPQCRPEVRWEGPMVELALATLNAAIETYRIDESRIVLTGLSLGGYGTWRIASMHPERFSCAVPVCGGGDSAWAPQLAKLPIWCWHGDADTVVPAERSRTMVEAVRAAGGDVRYDELPGVGHNSWDACYQNAEVAAWMLANRRR